MRCLGDAVLSPRVT